MHAVFSYLYFCTSKPGWYAFVKLYWGHISKCSHVSSTSNISITSNYLPIHNSALVVWPLSSECFIQCLLHSEISTSVESNTEIENNSYACYMFKSMKYWPYFLMLRYSLHFLPLRAVVEAKCLASGSALSLCLCGCNWSILAPFSLQTRLVTCKCHMDSLFNEKNNDSKMLYRGTWGREGKLLFHSQSCLQIISHWSLNPSRPQSFTWQAHTGWLTPY